MLIHWYRASNWLHKHHMPFLAKVIWKMSYLLFNSSLPPTAEIGQGTKLAYGGIGIVVHGRSVVGKNCILGQNITIGGKSGWYEVPVIGNNVHISAGARILGPVRVGNNVLIGANAVVVKDVPDNCVVAGVPAKIIKENLTAEDIASYGQLRYRGDNGWEMTPKAE
jgi:serine O-acetyltransferase